MNYIQGDTSKVFVFLMVDATDGKTGRTQAQIGGLPTVKLSKNGGGGVDPTGVIAEVDASTHPGLFKLTPSAQDVGTQGPIALHASGSGCVAVDQLHNVVPGRVKPGRTW